ncbi:lysM domain-containing GPI-anchored protein 1-like [Hibiscus syriacus]|uniref:lysM domain-containing GPI-anchored protein 1-like n=1 Tax=Hibiscus syriacus TaxID=106335 RepID=UPI0019208BC2|nr:lysM domain-containing GPI-anchored protein 1-like [Hibiscus syriacus]
MQCKGNNLKLGNVTVQQSSAGCNVTSCAYGGYANGTIITLLSSSLQPQCPGLQQFPPLVAPPTYVLDSVFAPAPTPQTDGTTKTVPKTSTVPSIGSLPGLSPAGAPLGSMSDASTLANSVATLPAALMLCFLIKLISSFSL